LILAAMFMLDRATAFPGWWALLPTVGSLFLISAGPNAWVNRYVLGNRALVFVGLISYPLYLWHWPLLSYAQIMAAETPTAGIRLAMVAAAFLLASLTYLMLEKPIRTQSLAAAPVLAACLGIVACAGFTVFSGRLHARSENYAAANIAKAATRQWGFPDARLKSVRTELGYHFERSNGAHKVLFVGDSHVEQYYPRVDWILTEQPNTAKGVVFVTHRLCPPIHPIEGYTRASCAGMLENAFDMARSPGVDSVVIGAAWNRYDVFQSKDSDAAFNDLAVTIGAFRKMGHHVYVILPIPRGEAFDPSILVKRSLTNFGFVVQRQVTRAEVDLNLTPIASRLSEIANSAGASTLNPVDYICRPQICPTLDADGLSVYTDDSHLRSAFVREHVTFLDSIISEPAPVIIRTAER
jgi:hypothetical protein